MKRTAAPATTVSAQPPFMVQAYRSGQHTQWFTDSRSDTLEAAIESARRLIAEWGRKVRVVDQAEQVWFRGQP